MSYTAPQYVDTKEQAILALASTIAGEDKTALGNGSVNKALDVLADVLAQQDVDVPQTNAGAILALAQYAQGGGGASTQTTDVYLWNNSQAALKTVVPTSVGYVSGFDELSGNVIITELSFEPVTVYEEEVATSYGVHVINVPVGCSLEVTIDTEYVMDGFTTGYAWGENQLPFMPLSSCCPMPIDGYSITGYYAVAQ